MAADCCLVVTRRYSAVCVVPIRPVVVVSGTLCAMKHSKMADDASRSKGAAEEAGRLKQAGE